MTGFIFSIFAFWVIFAEKTNFTRKRDIELKRRNYCFSIYNNFLSFLFFDCLWIGIFFIFIILFLILVCKNTHSYCFWWENLWINFLWNQEKYFTIILNTSNTYSTDCERALCFFVLRILVLLGVLTFFEHLTWFLWYTLNQDEYLWIVMFLLLHWIA